MAILGLPGTNQWPLLFIMQPAEAEQLSGGVSSTLVGLVLTHEAPQGLPGKIVNPKPIGRVLQH